VPAISAATVLRSARPVPQQGFWLAPKRVSRSPDKGSGRTRLLRDRALNRGLMAPAYSPRSDGLGSKSFLPVVLVGVSSSWYARLAR
jgi:hypothetical protein